jgi:hypothetical protein
MRFAVSRRIAFIYNRASFSSFFASFLGKFLAYNINYGVFSLLKLEYYKVVPAIITYCCK